MTPLESVRSRIPAPETAPALRWGVVGTGWIADRFVDSVQQHTSQQFVAVGSRDAQRGEAFARRHGIADVRDGVAGLVADPEVEVVYIASPHTQHREHALAAIAAGKHVLVEKPIGIDAAEAIEIADAARRAGVFCAEALWTFFLPRWDVVNQLLELGVIGELRSVQAEYGEYLPPDHRAMDPELAGGSLLDLGTYPIAAISRLLGTLTRVDAVGTNAPSGVNAQTAAFMADEAGAIGVAFTSLAASTPTTAVISGTEGSIELAGPFYQPGSVVVRTWADGDVFRFDEPAVAHEGLHWEAAAVARSIAEGRTEVAERPLDESVAFLQLMDRVRASAGIVFR